MSAQIAYVRRWYDRQSRNWIIQKLDVAGNQIGDAGFAGERRGAAAVESDFVAEMASQIRGLIPLAERRKEFGASQTGARHIICGTVFESWRVGIGRYERRTLDGRIRLGSRFSRGQTFSASVDGHWLPKAFRHETAAVNAALKEVFK